MEDIAVFIAARDASHVQVDERVFVALSDPTRRQLLDELYRRDGQRPRELGLKFSTSHQAVLKHLHILEVAGLIKAERSARKTFYYLNPAPLQHIQSRWLEKFNRPRDRSTTVAPRC